jgi:putative salt-induced outer membrane protein
MNFFKLVPMILILCSNLQAQTTNESELAIIIAKGNSDSQSYTAKELVKSTWAEVNTLKFSGRYLKTETAGIENARFWSTGLRYDLALSHRFSIFIGELLESDKYAGYNQKYNSDIGAKYSIAKEPKWLWDAELGYRYTIENQLTGVQHKLNYLRAYTEATKILSAGVSTKFWFEYLPNFTIGSDYQMNSELSISAAINSIFAIKTGYLLRYDNLPNPGAHAKTDTLFTTALVAKF